MGRTFDLRPVWGGGVICTVRGNVRSLLRDGRTCWLLTSWRIRTVVRNWNAIMDQRRALSSFRVSRMQVAAAVFCYCAAVAIVQTVVISVQAGEETTGRSDPLCPDDGCATVQCPHDRDACPLGLVPDGCSCCPYGVCGLGEAVECNTYNRPCADNLECVLTVMICSRDSSTSRDFNQRGGMCFIDFKVMRFCG